MKLYRDALEYKTDPEQRLGALHTIALLQEAELSDDAGAVETYRAALDVDEGDQHALEALSRLYARGERWRDLADLTRRRAEQSALPEDEASLRMELAKLLVRRLGETQAGIDELQTVVELAPVAGDGPGAEAVATLEELLHQPAHKARVVDILRPIYERADDWRHLVAVNEQRLQLAAEVGERVAILRENAALWEKRGGDRRRAFDAIRQAWILDPEDGDARGELDRLAEATRRWDDLAAAYETAIAKTDGLTKRELLSALAQLHDKRRDDPRRALVAWDRLFSLDETELEPLDEMDALATLLSDWAALVRVLVKKVELVPDDEARASTWRRVGEARRDMLDDPARGHRGVRAGARARAREHADDRLPRRALRAAERRRAPRRPLPPPRRALRRRRGGPQVPAARRRGASLRERPVGSARGDRVPRAGARACATRTARSCAASTLSTRTSACGPSCSTT